MTAICIITIYFGEDFIECHLTLDSCNLAEGKAKRKLVRTSKTWRNRNWRNKKPSLINTYFFKKISKIIFWIVFLVHTSMGKSPLKLLNENYSIFSVAEFLRHHILLYLCRKWITHIVLLSGRTSPIVSVKLFTFSLTVCKSNCK